MVMLAVALLILSALAGYYILDLRAQGDATQRRLECTTGKAVEKDVAQLGFDIKYSRYVQALGGIGDIAVAQREIVEATDELERVQKSRGQTEEQCAS